MLRRNPALAWSITLGAALATSGAYALALQPEASQPKEKDAPAPASAPDDAAAQARQELQAAEKLYKNAKTYQDKGEVKTEMTAAGARVDTKPFSTAFERDGRFLWEFKHSAMPGGAPSQQYTVWSKDQKSFNSYWTLQRSKTTEDQLDMAMAGPTGISGGAATVVIPLLRPDMRWGIRTTHLTDPVLKGKEKVGEVECTKIEGKEFGGADVTIWLDPSRAIRKVYTVREIDPSKIPQPPGGGGGAMPKFTVKTTITLDPTFDQKIDDKAFEPPKEAK